MIILVIYGFHVGQRLSEKTYPVVDNIKEIKNGITSAHLALEEILTGDKSEVIADVNSQMDISISRARMLLAEAVDHGEFGFNVITRDDHQSINDLLGDIIILKNLANQRYKNIGQSGIGTKVDREFDSICNQVTIKASLVELDLLKRIKSELSKFHIMKKIIVLVIVMFTIVLLGVFYKHEKHREKILSGIIPICASCKKIRDDEGYWKQIESYISDRTHATFTHSYCQSCIKKLYPDVADEVIAELESET